MARSHILSSVQRVAQCMLPLVLCSWFTRLALALGLVVIGISRLGCVPRCHLETDPIISLVPKVAKIQAVVTITAFSWLWPLTQTLQRDEKN